MKNKLLLPMLIFVMILGGSSSENITAKEFYSYEGRIIRVSGNTIFVEYYSSDSTHTNEYSPSLHEVENMEIYKIGQNVRIRVDSSNKDFVSKTLNKEKNVLAKTDNNLDKSKAVNIKPSELWFNYMGSMILMSKGDDVWKTESDKDDYGIFGSKTVNAASLSDYFHVKSGAYFHVNSESEVSLKTRKVYFWAEKHVGIELNKTDNEFQLPEKLGEYCIEVFSEYANEFVSDVIYVFAE